MWQTRSFILNKFDLNRKFAFNRSVNQNLCLLIINEPFLSIFCKYPLTVNRDVVPSNQSVLLSNFV